MDTRSPVRVYGWPDGSSVWLDASDPDGRGAVLFDVDVAVGRAPTVRLGLLGGLPREIFLWDDDGPVSFPDQANIESLSVQKKLRGFLLDLGVDRPKLPAHPKSLIYSRGSDDVLPTVRWVPKDRWRERFDEARRFVTRRDGTIAAGEGAVFLDFVEDLEIERPEPGEKWWKASWAPNNSDSTDQGLSNLVDIILDIEDIAEEEPVSMALVERDEVERGQFLVPTPDELELYRMLGEPQPLLWDLPALRKWLEDQP